MAQYEPPIAEFWDHSVTIWHPTEPTPMGALMAALPGHDPADSILDRQPLREAVAICMELLSAEDQYVLDRLAHGADHDSGPGGTDGAAQELHVPARQTGRDPAARRVHDGRDDPGVSGDRRGDPSTADGRGGRG